MPNSSQALTLLQLYHNITNHILSVPQERAPVVPPISPFISLSGVQGLIIWSSI